MRPSEFLGVGENRIKHGQRKSPCAECDGEYGEGTNSPLSRSDRLASRITSGTHEFYRRRGPGCYTHGRVAASHREITIAEKILAAKSGKSSVQSRRDRRSLPRPGHEPHGHVAFGQRDEQSRRDQAVRPQPAGGGAGPHRSGQVGEERSRSSDVPDLRRANTESRNSTMSTPASRTWC